MNSLSSKLMSFQTALSELHQTASLATFSGDALTDLLAGLAANSIGSFVKGFTPLRASVAGLFTTDILTKPGMTNSPDSFNSVPSGIWLELGVARSPVT